jgi:AraC-like DNA-binding protein
MTADANPLTSRAMRDVQEGPPTPAAQFRAWVDAFERLGYDANALLEAAGIARAALDDPDLLVPCSASGAMVARAQSIRPLKNLWAQLASATPITAFALLDYLVHTSDDVGEAFKQLARYLRLIAAPFALDIKDNEEPVRVVCLMAAWAAPASVEYGVALNIRRIGEETNHRAVFAFASFRHEPDDVAALEQLLGCPVQAPASWSGMALTREGWRMPLLRRDPILRRVLEGQADRVPPGETPPSEVVVGIRRALAVRLPRGEIDIETIARDVGMSTRTLQRRLFARGASFQELLDDVRRETAEKCVADGTLSIGEIAYLVGYSEPAAFHRAFRRWTGTTPQAFRRSLAASPVRAHNRRPEEAS